MENTAFDLEWAKRGGVLYIMTDQVCGVAKYDSSIGGGEHWVKTTYGCYEVHEINIRMATQKEAGAEYVEPPPMRQPIETEPKGE